MNFEVKFNLDNSEFEEYYDLEEGIIKVLHRVINEIHNGNVRFPVRDINGNTIGTAELLT